MGSGLAGEGRGLGEEVARLHWEGQVLAKEQGALQGEEQCFKRDGAAGLLWRLRSCGEGAWAFCAGEGLLGSIAASTVFLRRIEAVLGEVGAVLRRSGAKLGRGCVAGGVGSRRGDLGWGKIGWCWGRRDCAGKGVGSAGGLVSQTQSLELMLYRAGMIVE